MVSALDSGSGGPGLSPRRGTALCSWARYFTLIVPLSTQASVVQRVDNAIHRINHYPVDSLVCFSNTYPLDSDLSGG